MKTTADVIIIGGGIEGCSTAYDPSKRGITDVIVLEAQEIMLNGGASRNAGGVRQSGRDPRELPLALYGVKNIWPTLGEELGVDVEYNQGGNLRLGKTEEHLKKLTKLADNAAACGVGVGMITGDEARDINPYLSDAVIGASWCPTDGHANPLKTGLGFYRRAIAAGVQFITGEKVLALRKVRGHLRKVIAEHNVYEADTILVCALMHPFARVSIIAWLLRASLTCSTRCSARPRLTSTAVRRITVRSCSAVTMTLRASTFMT